MENLYRYIENFFNVLQTLPVYHVLSFPIGHKLRHIIGVSPWRVSNPFTGGGGTYYIMYIYSGLSLKGH